VYQTVHSRFRESVADLFVFHGQNQILTDLKRKIVGNSFPLSQPAPLLTFIFGCLLRLNSPRSIASVIELVQFTSPLTEILAPPMKLLDSSDSKEVWGHFRSSLVFTLPSRQVSSVPSLSVVAFHQFSSHYSFLFPPKCLFPSPRSHVETLTMSRQVSWGRKLERDRRITTFSLRKRTNWKRNTKVLPGNLPRTFDEINSKRLQRLKNLNKLTKKRKLKRLNILKYHYKKKGVFTSQVSVSASPRFSQKNETYSKFNTTLNIDNNTRGSIQ
jgi:hypothetical protein